MAGMYLLHLIFPLSSRPMTWEVSVIRSSLKASELSSDSGLSCRSSSLWATCGEQMYLASFHEAECTECAIVCSLHGEVAEQVGFVSAPTFFCFLPKGGGGALAQEYVSLYPNSTITIYDLPKVIQVAKEQFVPPEEHRITFHEGRCGQWCSVVTAVAPEPLVSAQRYHTGGSGLQLSLMWAECPILQLPQPRSAIHCYHRAVPVVHLQLPSIRDNSVIQHPRNFLLLNRTISFLQNERILTQK